MVRSMAPRVLSPASRREADAWCAAVPMVEWVSLFSARGLGSIEFPLRANPDLGLTLLAVAGLAVG